MTALQARLLAARSVRAAQAQETFARRLRPGGTATDIPGQRGPDDEATATVIVLSATSR